MTTGPGGHAPMSPFWLHPLANNETKMISKVKQYYYESYKSDVLQQFWFDELDSP